MTNKKSKEVLNDVSRRKFLQGGAVLGAAVGLSAISGNKEVSEEVAKAIGKKELDGFPHEIAPDFKRFDASNCTFDRKDPEFQSRLKGLPGIYNVIDDTQPGYTTIDYNLAKGGRAITSDFSSVAFNMSHHIPNENKYEFASKEDATKVIKKAAKYYGASLVGITPYDETWMYKPITSFGSDGYFVNDEDLPFKPKSVIVMAIEYDYKMVQLAPSTLTETEMGKNYSTMLEITHKLSAMINSLGYRAFSAENDKALSVPYAIAAGLGEQGRQGILITYEYGPRVGLCKVFTEMELNYDKPIEFGANKFCQVCKKCAESCPSQSISFKDEMTWGGEVPSISNIAGVHKYYVDVESCYVYWSTIGNGCCCCIAACPFNKPDFWHHRITTALTATPLKPFLNEMDSLFGYGNIFDEKACSDFWDLDVYIK